MDDHADLRQLWAETLAASPDPSETLGAQPGHLLANSPTLPTAWLVHTVPGGSDAATAQEALADTQVDDPSVTDETYVADTSPVITDETYVAASAPSVTDETFAADAAYVRSTSQPAAKPAAPLVSASLHRARERFTTVAEGPVQPRFELLDKVGEGGMGVVWRANQESLGREVAIKMLRSTAGVRPDQTPASDERRSRFVAESVITGQLDHPNVVPVHELGQDADGSPFLAMKLVRGRSWQAVLHPKSAADRAESARWDLRRHIDVLLQVSNGIAYAHAHDIIHRDIKPDNVMVGAYGEVMVMDWGIAVHIGVELPADPRLPHRSRVSGPAGTPTYMAPEQAEGRGALLGVCTDVYLLGATLHEILTGAPPHRGTELFEVLLAASRSVPQVYGDEVPAPLAAICLRAMARDPSARFPSVEAFRAAVQLWLDHAESLRLSGEADLEVRRLQTADAVPHEERYAVWARALGRYEQALGMWPENQPALHGQAQAIVGYAEEALRRRDVGLARAQLTALEGHANADPVALSSLRNAIKRATVGWQRLAAGVAMALMVVGVGWWGLAAARADVAAQSLRVRNHTQLHTQLRHAWSAVVSGEPSAGLRAIERDEVVALAQGDTDRAAIVDLQLAGLLALWRDARWDTLARHACHVLVARSDAQTAAAVRAAAVTVGAGADSGDDTHTCQRLRHASGAAAGRALAAIGHLRADVSPGYQAIAALLQIGVCGRQRALQLPGAPTACRDWHVAAVPLAAATTAAIAAVDPPEFGDGPWGEVVARDNFDGATLWQTLPVAADARDQHGTRWLPTVAGHVLVVQGAELQLRHGRTGRVFARRGLPGRVAMIAPDPLDPTVTLAAVLVNGARHREHSWLRLRLEDPTPPPPSGDSVAHYRMGGMAEALADVAPSPRALVVLLADGARQDPGAASVAASLLSLLRKLPETCASPDATVTIGTVQLRPCLSREAAHAEVHTRLGRAALPTLRRAVIEGTASHVVLGQVVAAMRLDAVGLQAGAARIIARARRDQLRGGANLELAVGVVGTPAGALRQRGDEVWQREGATSEGRRKALAWARDSLDFSLAIEGDAGFAPALTSWLATHPEDAPAGLEARLPALRRTSRPMGPYAMIQPWRLHVLDAAYGLTFGGPITLFLLTLWLWFRSRSARLLALYGRGFRSRRERLAAFLTFPLLRLRHMTWSYLSRGERLVLLVAGVATLFGATMFIASVSMVHQLERGEASLSMGRLDMPGLERTLARQLERYAPSAAFRRLQSEAAWLRGDWATARLAATDANKRQPLDTRALNNLAVLSERAGELADARAGYKAAANKAGPEASEGGTGGGDAGRAAATYNLARLAGHAPDPSHLALRDQPHATPGKPLWARSSLQDLRGVVLPDLSRQETLRRTVAQLLTGRTVLSLLSFMGEPATSPALLRAASVGIAVGCLLLTLFALIWLPMPVLPQVPPSPNPESSALKRLINGVLGLRSPVPYAVLLAWLGLVLSAALPVWRAASHLGATTVVTQLRLFTHYFDGLRLATDADTQVAQYGAAVGITCVCLALAVLAHGAWSLWRQMMGVR